MWWHAAIALAAALLLQMEIVHFVTFRGAQLSIVLVLVVWYAMRSGARQSLVFGLAAGLCEDALSAGTGGAWTLSTVLTAVAVSQVTRPFFADSIPVFFSAAFAATLLRRLIFWIVMALQGYPAGYAAMHAHQALWEALLNALFALAASLMMRSIAQARSA